MLEIKEVTTRRDIKEFITFPLKLYKNSKSFVPPLYRDEKKLLEAPKSTDITDTVFYLAVQNGKTVGRIQGIIQKQYNQIHNTAEVRFTRFDCIDEQRVASALLYSVEKWGCERGMTEICGPLGANDLDREGLLIEGFEENSTFEEQYNYEYYPSLIEGCGYSKEVDWLEFMLRAPENPNPMLAKVAARALELNKLHVVDHTKYSKRAYIDRYKDRFFDCIDRCYSHLYGTVPFTESMKKQLVDQFMAI